MKFEDGDLLYIVLSTGQEVIGTWGSQEGVEEGFYKFYGVCFVGMTVIQTPEGPRQRKIMIPAKHEIDFHEDVIVGKSQISICRKVVIKSDFQKEYIRATTGIAVTEQLPPPLEMKVTRRLR